MNYNIILLLTSSLLPLLSCIHNLPDSKKSESSATECRGTSRLGVSSSSQHHGNLRTTKISIFYTLLPQEVTVPTVASPSPVVVSPSPAVASPSSTDTTSVLNNFFLSSHLSTCRISFFTSFVNTLSISFFTSSISFCTSAAMFCGGEHLHHWLKKTASKYWFDLHTYISTCHTHSLNWTPPNHLNFRSKS